MQDMEEDVSRFLYDDHDAYLLFFIFSVLGAFFPSSRRNALEKSRGAAAIGWAKNQQLAFQPILIL